MIYITDLVPGTFCLIDNGRLCLVISNTKSPPSAFVSVQFNTLKYLYIDPSECNNIGTMTWFTNKPLQHWKKL